jgi:RHS repeat-associated protein
VWRRVAGEDFPLLTLTTRDAAGQVREATFGNGVILARALDISGRLEGQLSDDTATLARGGPGGGGFIDGVTVLPEARSVPLPWLVLPIAMALLIRLGLMASGRRATDTPLILLALTDGVLIAALLSPRTVEALVIGYDYDARGNIEARRFDGQAQSFSHDALDRLRSEAGAAATQSFGLDANGNRLSDGTGSYTITPNSNRLATAPDYTPEVDAAGYTRAYRDAQTNETLMAFAWDTAGDLAEVEAGGQLLATYSYDHRHLRVTKTADGATTVYHHNASGQLIAETRSSGEPLRSYVWLEGAPVAVIEHAALTGATERTLYLEPDLLMTPRAATDDEGRTVWTWKGDAFGTTLPEDDPDGDGTPTTLHLRFPGQYFDTETGLHYNWHRYYEPWTGRYLSSDPIGLRGGGALFVYTGSRPLRLKDENGLEPDVPYPSMDEAACGLACDAGRYPPTKEYGGLLYECPGGVCYTRPYHNPNPKHPDTTWRPDWDTVPADRRVCADLHTHWRKPGYRRTWNQVHEGDRLSNWYLGRVGYVSTPDSGLLRYRPDGDGPPGSGPVDRVDCTCR